jgi:hypothetical protein
MGASCESEGFAAVDAMVALTILATTVALALVAVEVGRRDSEAALRLERATDLLAYVLAASPDRIGEESGKAPGYDWRRVIAPSVDDLGPALPALCTRWAEVRSLVDGRRYSLATTEICPVASASTG